MSKSTRRPPTIEPTIFPTSCPVFDVLLFVVMQSPQQARSDDVLVRSVRGQHPPLPPPSWVTDGHDSAEALLLDVCHKLHQEEVELNHMSWQPITG